MTVSDLLIPRRWLLAVAIAAASMPIAHAQVPPLANCAPRADLLKELTGQYAERTVALGLAEGGSAVVEILSSADGETWTMLYSLSTGRSCVIASGRHWEVLTHTAALGPEV